MFKEDKNLSEQLRRIRGENKPSDGKEYTPVEILKLCAGFSYQACETPDWEQSIAYSLIRRIEKAAIDKLPGYDDAPWDM
jgi:hypothetical protein